MKRALEFLVGITFAASLTLVILEWLLDWLIRRMMAVGGVHIP